jgi:signal transduction histidine kinase
VDERTAQLASANAELEAFSYSVSHDLRSPLRTIDGFSELLLEGHYDEFDDGGRELLGRMRRASQRMGELIDALLELARATRVQRSRTSLDVTAVASAALEEIDREEGVEFEIEQGMNAVGDPRLVDILITRLLSNAIKTLQRRGKISLSCSDGVFVLRDDGPGLEGDLPDRLFQPSVSLQDFDRFDGRGVGLVTIRRIIDVHGGWIRATSATGRGTTIRFTLDPEVPRPGFTVAP